MFQSLMRSRLLFAPAALLAALSGCMVTADSAPGGEEQPVSDTDGAAADLADATTSAGDGAAADPASATITSVQVRLQPRSGVSGTQRVNFAVPLPRGLLSDASRVNVRRGGTNLPSARRALSRYPDGSVRSVQIQVQIPISGATTLDVRLGEAPAGGNLARVPVSDTLVSSKGGQIPRVWALLPAGWMSASGVFGPLVTEASVAGTPLARWQEVCDYDHYDVDNFRSQMGNGTVWLYDRGTTLYRGYARRGDLNTLYSAYLETSIYRSGIVGWGAATRISIPEKEEDLKYFYTQNMALHYLLTGDDRFRESAEHLAYKMTMMFNPWYHGAFWTERFAGFLLLGYHWASVVSDDQADNYADLADDTVDAVLWLQAQPVPNYNNQAMRCFTHPAQSHGEVFGYRGCSPWMSAILADGLDAYATERGGARAAEVRASLIKLGRIIAAYGRDNTGRPYYWMGVGTSKKGEVDPYPEHWSEAAYLVSMAWYHGNKQEQWLKNVADDLVEGFNLEGEAPHMRSFNWQCRSAVATPYFMK